METLLGCIFIKFFEIAVQEIILDLIKMFWYIVFQRILKFFMLDLMVWFIWKIKFIWRSKFKSTVKKESSHTCYKL